MRRGRYPSLLREMGRLLSRAGRAVLFTAASQAALLEDRPTLAAAGLTRAATIALRFCNIPCVMVTERASRLHLPFQ